MIISDKEASEIERLSSEFVARMLELGGESAIVIVTAITGKNSETSMMLRGAGNLYAQIGSVQEFLNQQRSITQANELGHVIKRGDDGEDWK